MHRFDVVVKAMCVDDCMEGCKNRLDG